MAKCPNCQESLTEDFGLATCSNCGAAVFVEMDGSVRVQTGVVEDAPIQGASVELDTSDDGPVEYESMAGTVGVAPLSGAYELEPPPIADYEEPIEVEEPKQEQAFESDQLDADEFSEFSKADSTDDYAPEPSEYQDNQNYESEDINFDASNNEENALFGSETEVIQEVDDKLDTSEELSEDPPEVCDGSEISANVDGPSVKAASPISEIAGYANSEVSQAQDGQFVYTLMIKGIDSKEIRDGLANALTDDKFRWNVREVMGAIDKGELILANLNPVKAHVLVNRIKFLPLEISWEQNDITA